MESKTTHRDTAQRASMLVVVSAIVTTLLIAPTRANGQGDLAASDLTEAEQRVVLGEKHRSWLVEWGFRAGANLSAMSGFSGFDAEVQLFPTLGGLARLQLGGAQIQTGLAYARKGVVVAVQEADLEATPSYLVVPLLYRYTPQWLLSNSPGLQPYALAGLYAGVHVTGGEDLGDGPSRFDLGFTTGLGMSWHATKSTIIDFEIEYSQSFSDIYSGGMSQRHQVGMVSVGFAYDRGGDQDRDGFRNREDPCWTEAEDSDVLESKLDGCPDLDNDGDGILDQWDESAGEELGCMSDDSAERPECKSGKGEHNFDTVEDKDGFEDFDGRRDLDNDQDGFADARQKADDPEEFEQKKDRCPDRAYWLPFDKKPSLGFKPEEKASSDPFWAGREFGCPGKYDEYFFVVPPYIIPSRPIDGFDKNSATLTGEHKAVLDEVARFLENYPWVNPTIVGHSTAKEKNGVDQRRADEARLYLINTKGIAPNRLLADGRDTQVPLVQSYRPPTDGDPRKQIQEMEKRQKQIDARLPQIEKKLESAQAKRAGAGTFDLTYARDLQEFDRLEKERQTLETRLERYRRLVPAWDRYKELEKTAPAIERNRRITFFLDPMRQ